MKLAQKIIIVVLVLAALIGAYMIYKQQQGLVSETPAANPQSQNTQNNPPPSSQSKVQELAAANPGANATTDQLKEYSSKVFQAATQGTSLDVTACAPTPAILNIKLNSALTIKNTDAVDHKLVNGTNINLDVAAASSKGYSLKLPLGIYIYTCDSKISGIIMVTP